MPLTYLLNQFKVKCISIVRKYLSKNHFSRRKKKYFKTSLSNHPIILINPPENQFKTGKSFKGSTEQLREYLPTPKKMLNSSKLKKNINLCLTKFSLSILWENGDYIKLNRGT